jgi:hypothetical protein
MIFDPNEAFQNLWIRIRKTTFPKILLTFCGKLNFSEICKYTKKVYSLDLYINYISIILPAKVYVGSRSEDSKIRTQTSGSGSGRIRP